MKDLDDLIISAHMAKTTKELFILKQKHMELMIKLGAKREKVLGI